MKFNFNSTGSIESTIDSIAAIMTTNASDGSIMKKEGPVKGQCLKGMITVTARHKAGVTCNRESTVKYAFYASSIHPTRLGSVAIYADDLSSILSAIRRTKSFFGFPVTNVAVEYGRRPFLDVTLSHQV